MPPGNSLSDMLPVVPAAPRAPLPVTTLPLTCFSLGDFSAHRLTSKVLILTPLRRSSLMAAPWHQLQCIHDVMYGKECTVSFHLSWEQVP